ncbi:hypothetical protein MUK42_32076 [Musa troglodytarum]|uniref:Uncharacterized protein n=1 Tax=Musa troglodytarum TaxID=320322 RepID=A0A9E7FLG7_9LILI|nr:hypothetical protein MUK42_32076 [Musa troglodytarum]
MMWWERGMGLESASSRRRLSSLRSPRRKRYGVPWSPCARSKRSCRLGLHHAWFSAHTAQAKSSSHATPNPKLHSLSTDTDSAMESSSKEQEGRRLQRSGDGIGCCNAALSHG